MELSPVETRVLGSLMEKAVTTPEQYPLTLRALASACNQKTSRDPVTDYDEDEVEDALESLRAMGLAMRVDMAGSRTAKFREEASRKWELQRQEYALLTTLLLRGPQTPGQLRQRSERLFAFADLDQVSDWLKRMQDREDEPLTLVASLGRSPGTKEIRYGHTLSPVPDEASLELAPATEPTGKSHESASPLRDRIAELEKDVDSLKERVATLETLLNDLTS